MALGLSLVAMLSCLPAPEKPFQEVDSHVHAPNQQTTESFERQGQGRAAIMGRAAGDGSAQGHGGIYGERAAKGRRVGPGVPEGSARVGEAEALGSAHRPIATSCLPFRDCCDPVPKGRMDLCPESCNKKCLQKTKEGSARGGQATDAEARLPGDVIWTCVPSKNYLLLNECYPSKKVGQKEKAK
jgi:hypothetical protein